MIIIQLILFCLLFIGMVKLGVGNEGINEIFFYPKAVQERAVDIGLTDWDTIRRKKRRFMIPFLLILLAALLLIIGLWNGASDFKTAYLQALLFLEVMNWFDGIVIDRLWVGHSKIWIIPGTKDIPFVKPWPQILKKRGIGFVIWVAGAAIVAGLVVLIF
ncbi:MAG: hypothetical protein Q4F41_12975 [Eubacteriales bacterium]|nr:hypothetical protein [Eubacteriales bacterium]